MLIPMMHSISWWPSLGVLTIASIIDLYTRKVPNWLSVPFLFAGLAVSSAMGGWSGAVSSLTGIALAALLFGIPVLLRGMGMGDLKLAAGIGAWIGPGQLFFAFIMTGIFGGIIALAYAAWRGKLGRSLDRTSDLLFRARTSRGETGHRQELGSPNAMAIPYAPAIALGTIFSFLAN